MPTHRIIERYAELIKEEPLSTLEKDMTISDTCVLESTSPFFGYYQDAPVSEPDPYIYCMLKHPFSMGEIARITARINSTRINPLDVAVGNLDMRTKSCPVIRIKNIHQYRIKEIQDIYQAEGIQFEKRQRPVKNEMIVIRLNKFLQLSELGDGLYMDALDDTKAYFELPGYIDWESFKKLTEEVKYETRILNFDAARATIFKGNQIIELVRVYKKHINAEQLKVIRDRYMKLIG
jgi:hypothetical protein